MWSCSSDVVAHYVSANEVQLPHWRLCAAATHLYAPWLHMPAVSLKPVLCSLSWFEAWPDTKFLPLSLVLHHSMFISWFSLAFLQHSRARGQELSGETSSFQGMAQTEVVCRKFFEQSFLSTVTLCSQRQHKYYVTKSPAHLSLP